MFTSLRARLWLTYALLIATAMGVMAVAFGLYLWSNPLLYRQTLARLRIVESAIINRQSDLQGHTIAASIERAANEFDVRILLFNRSGSVLVDTAPSQPDLKLPRRPFFNRDNPTIRDASGSAWLYTRETLDEGAILMVAIHRPRVRLLNILRDEFLPIFLQGGAIALILSLVLAFVVARWVADPLQRLVEASQHVPVTDAKPVIETGPREVRELTFAFNAMVDRVRSSQDSQRKFAANVSHELKTPLTSIQGFAQAIIDGTAKSPSEQKQAAEVIYKESGRMHRMVLDLLDLARLDAGTADLNMSQVNLRALLDSIVEKFSLQAHKDKVTLVVDSPRDLPYLVADGDRLAQVFTNLVDNALRHTGRDGQVILQSQATQTEMEIRVADTGIGLPADAIPHIFERFYQADPSRPGGERRGAGLGLAIVQEIVAAHSGRISVRSQEGLGTTFTVYLPLVQPAATTLLSRKR
ncbi:MAG: ATP-binding protein [Anaerolineae bacterium]|nr:ATP-binding protein [Anaerolineae bacterium]MDK1080642.1 ATP-binding protein [Anaerolineae bacterium]MDK1117707.1 ATP-binding protein [Anaerolineae bacterium]